MVVEIDYRSPVSLLRSLATASVAFATVLSACSAPNPAYDGGADGTRSGTDGATGGTGLLGVTGDDGGRGSAGTTGDDDSGVTSADGATTHDVFTSGPPADSMGGEGETTASGSDWWNDAYPNRIRIDFLPRAEVLDDFGAFVDLDLGNNVFQDVEEQSFAFVSIDTGQPLASEIAQVTSSGGRLRAWVQLPHWKNDAVTSVDLYFGVDAPMVAPMSPWQDPYIGVWHMDRTAAGLTPNAAGGPPAVLVDPSGEIADVAGHVFRALEFDGIQDRLSVEFPIAPPKIFTVYGWANFTEIADLGAPLFARGGNVGSEPADTEWLLRFYPDSVEARLHAAPELAAEAVLLDGSTPMTGQWHHYVIRASETEFAVFVDGDLVDEESLSGIDDHVLDVLSIGGYATEDAKGWESRLVQGRVDEIVWRAGVVSDAWIGTLYDNQDEPEQTYTVGRLQIQGA